MIPMQLMIGQLMGQPVPIYHQIEPTRIHTLSDHGNSTAYGRTQAETQADANRTKKSLEKIRANLRKYYANRMFTRNTVKREALFPHSKANLPIVIKEMMESGELLLHASDNRGEIYLFAAAENPDPIQFDPRLGALVVKVARMRQFVLTWSQAKTGFSTKALQNVQQDFGIGPSMAIQEMLDDGELEIVPSRGGRRIYKLKDKSA